MEDENLKSDPKPKLCDQAESVTACTILCVSVLALILWYIVFDPHKIQIPEIELVSMDFAASVHNNSSSLDPLCSARWDLSIRVPKELVGNYICLQGNFQASFLYKHVTLVTSSTQSYVRLKFNQPQLLNISAVATEKDLSGAIGKEIMEAIKERNELRFGSRFSLTGCREKKKDTMMSYECDETTLRFEAGSNQIKATAFGNQPTCIANV